MSQTTNKKKSFILYYDMLEVVKLLNPKECKELWLAVLSTGGVCECPELSREAQLAFIPIKNSIEREAEKWEKTRETRSKAGKKSGEVRRQKRDAANAVDEDELLA